MTKDNIVAGGFAFKPPKSFLFFPKHDITPLESAWISHLFFVLSKKVFYEPDEHPEWEQIKRHFTEIKP